MLLFHQLMENLIYNWVMKSGCENQFIVLYVKTAQRPTRMMTFFNHE
jgi:hypothetical protein